MLQRSGAPLAETILTRAFAATGDCIAVLAPNGTIATLIGEGRLADCSPLTGRNWLDFWHGADHAAARQAVEAAVAGQLSTIRGFLPTAAGRPAWWESTIMPFEPDDPGDDRELVITRDVTREQQAQAALKRSAALNGALIAATAEIVWHLDLATGLTERQGWEAFTGSPDDPADVYGWLVHMHPDDRDEAERAARAADRDGTVLTLEYRLRHHSGSWRWVEDRAVPMVGEDGQVTDWVGIITDIHDRKAADQHLRHGEERLRLALESSALGTWDFDVRTGEQEWSPEARQIIGVSPDDLISDDTLLVRIHPADRPAMLDQHRVGVEGLHAGTTMVAFRVVHGETGETRWIAKRGRMLLDEQGRPMRHIGTFEDFTERKKTRDALRHALRRHEALVAASSDIVWFANARQTAGESLGWEAFTGSPEAMSVSGRWLDSIHPDDHETVRRVVDEAVRTGRNYSNEYRLRHQDGAWRWVVDKAVAVKNDDGSVEEWAGIITDIHERRTAEDRLRRSEERLRLAIDTAGLGTLELDCVTGERLWSDEFRRMFGIEPSVTPSFEAMLDCIVSEDRELVAAHRQTSLTDQLIQRVEYRIDNRQTGLTQWISHHCKPIVEGGRVVRLIGTVQDMTKRNAMRDALRTALRRHQALIDATSSIVWRFNCAEDVAERHGWQEFTGQPAGPGSTSWIAAVHPEDREALEALIEQSTTTGTPYIGEYRLQHRTGGWRWVQDHAVPLKDADGAVAEWVGIVSDIHDRKSAESALKTNAERLRLAIEATGLGTWDVNVRTDEREWSPEYFDLLGLPRSTKPNRDLFLQAVHPDDRGQVLRDFETSRAVGSGVQTSVFRFCLPDGRERWIEMHERVFHEGGEPVRRVGTMQDVTLRKQAEHELWLAAHSDGLTGVANRALFQIRLDAAVSAAADGRHGVGLLILDLDRFKDVNDSMGHDAGDLLLRTVAQRLIRVAPAEATVARLGGDEFGVILPDADPAAIEATAAGILEAMAEPLAYEGREMDCSASIGWSVYPDHDIHPAALLKNADVALYAAKEAGRGRAAGFEPAMREQVDRHVTVLRSARDALARDAILPFYQPKTSLATGEVIGFEALLRWTDESGLRTPGAIHEALNDPEVAGKIGTRMLERVTADMRGWVEAGVPFGHVAVNVAAPQFHGGGLAAEVLGRLEAAGLRPEQLEIEVTESVLLDDGPACIGPVLQALHAGGVAVALDDFGTGYASLTHLKTFPVSWLKIDRSFTASIETDAGSAAIVRAVIGLAHSIGIKVVAEGVETRPQWTFLEQIRCDLAQGYLIAKPMSGSRVPHFLASWRPQAVKAVPASLIGFRLPA